MPLLLSSAYLPPISFFTAMLESGGEVFIEQFDSYHKQTFRNRALIATSNGVQSLTIPVVKSEGGKMLMKDVRISDHGEWRHLHWNALETAYMNSPFFIYYQDDLRPFYEKRYEFLLDFNMELTQTIADLIGMKCSFKRTDEFVAEPVEVTDMRAAIKGATIPMPEIKPYYQVFAKKNGFLKDLSIVDLLFNMGPESILALKNRL